MSMDCVRRSVRVCDEIFFALGRVSQAGFFSFFIFHSVSFLFIFFFLGGGRGLINSKFSILSLLVLYICILLCFLFPSLHFLLVIPV